MGQLIALAEADLPPFARDPSAFEPLPRPEADNDAECVLVRRADLETLLLAADVVAEHHEALIDTTPVVAGTDTLLALEEAGIVDPDTLRPSYEFKAALARCGRALGQ